jgi:hypothetical protein
MIHFVGLDVSVKAKSVCVVDDAGKVVLEQKVRTEPADIIALLTSLGATYGRIGIEAGPLSQWLVNALTAAELPVICVGTRHMKALLTAQQINKTDRNDARGIAQMMRVGSVQGGACEDAGCPGTADAVDQPQAASAQSAGRGVRFARHAAQFRFGKWAPSAAFGTKRGSASSSQDFRGWPPSSSRCSVSAGSCASSWPSCTRCCWTRSAATRCAGG